MRQFWKNFKADYQKYCTLEFGPEPASIWQQLRMCLVEFGLHCVFVYRLGQYARGLQKGNYLVWPLFMVPYLVAEFLMRLLHHVQIVGEIGPGFYIGHVGTIYLGARSIGRNFSVAHNVTVGVGYSKGKIGHPVIGDNVWVGTGAVISGEIKIGNNVTIAPGCMLSSDVPDGFLVAGNPGRPLIKDYDNSQLFGRGVASEGNDGANSKAAEQSSAPSNQREN